MPDILLPVRSPKSLEKGRKLGSLSTLCSSSTEWRLCWDARSSSSGPGYSGRQGRESPFATLGVRLERTSLYTLNHGDLLTEGVLLITTRRTPTPRDHRPRASTRLYLGAAKQPAATCSYFSRT